MGRHVHNVEGGADGSGQDALFPKAVISGTFRPVMTAFFAAAVLIFGFVSGVNQADAAYYSATEMLRSAKVVEMAPGESKTFMIAFKNTGSVVWRRDGLGFVSVYTHGPKYRKSVFEDASWMNDVQPARLQEDSVAPGAIGRVSFTLFAPMQEGTYDETFHLAAEDTAWISGGQFSVEIRVRAPAQQVQTAAMISDRQNALGYKAFRMIMSANRITFDDSFQQTFRVAFKNIGRTTWRKSGSDAVELVAVPGNAYSFRDSTWPDNDTVALLPKNEVKPGELVFFDFKLTSPAIRGTYQPRFMLASGGEPIDGGTIDLPVDVKRGKVPSSVSTSPGSSGSGDAPLPTGSRGPDLRIGLMYLDDINDTISITADGPYRLLDGNDTTVTTLSGLTSITFNLATKEYTVRNGAFTRVLRQYLTLQPVSDSTVFEIMNIQNRPTWDPSLNFNRFRGSLEIFYTSNTDRLWIVEIVPLEDYLRGLAETSNASPFEYQKALVTAARTYAYFVHSIGGKHQKEFHDLNTTAGDQVYKGYVSEGVRPNVVRAVEETRGQLVTYNGDVVVTPYFSRSDGRTRSWGEVWYGSRPWLVSVPTPYDAGKTLWGHGVGLAASDAVGRAKDGASWTDILKYYYRGVDIRTVY